MKKGERLKADIAVILLYFLALFRMDRFYVEGMIAYS